MGRSSPFLATPKLRKLAFTVFLTHSAAMGLQIRQKLSSLGPILATPLSENAFDDQSPTGS